jgi:hypothetical protein
MLNNLTSVKILRILAQTFKDMATLKQARARAAIYGASIEIENRGDGEYMVEAIAPDGMQWTENGSVSICVPYGPDSGGDKASALDQLIQIMNHGIERE